VIQNKEVTRLGSNDPIPVDFRLISATNQPLFDMVEENTFREDLLYRINTIQIDLPPLRERPEDIQVLASYFLKQYTAKYRKEAFLSEKTLNLLSEYNWPGNIRELQHSIEKAVILSENKEISAGLIVPEKHATRKKTNTFNLEENEKDIIQQALHKFRGNISLTAEKLGINRSTLYAKMRKYEL
jgi:transcriptional regulator with PAS, ATPase and Fis domain